MSIETVANSAGDRQLDNVFHALSDPTRRALIARLAKRPCMVKELAEPYAMSLPAVSKHLKVLERAGLVSRTVDGRMHRCSFAPEPLQQAEQWISRYRAFWEDTLGALSGYIKRGKKQPIGS
jgi:DNA-binding transcriptional ArsR family regulator